jgi:hypothetical protein
MTVFWRDAKHTARYPAWLLTCSMIGPIFSLALIPTEAIGTQ